MSNLDATRLPLNTPWEFHAVPYSATSWARDARKLVTIHTVADFWRLMHHLPPNETCIWVLARQGHPIDWKQSPMGGCWSALSHSPDVFKEMAMAAIGETILRQDKFDVPMISISQKRPGLYNAKIFNSDRHYSDFHMWINGIRGFEKPIYTPNEKRA